mmetsp:Transcript_41983/g.74236  ORF Transcript_41983/g.74236 Transcript_41983/m.74236 type:complete len:268 (+) Transcript_41983:1249-2052(+)
MVENLFFSLDPKDPHDLSGKSLMKRFYPEWLASTVVGEVLFQADYTLKEICFGDKALPGMRSVFDDISAHTVGEELAARQWFTLRNAHISIAADGAVVPRVQMGVETRRLVKGPKGYEDAPYTAPDHPMVKQAKAVSDRFEEVAGHLPVVAELIAVARATLAARFLLECGCRCDDGVLQRYCNPRTPEGDYYKMEIPTLFKERANSMVVHDQAEGRLVVNQRRRHMHGGVDLAAPTKQVPSKAEKAKLLDPRDNPTPLPLFARAAGA